MKAILAIDEGGAIGWADGRLPWKLPADMQRFKDFTTNQAVVMGYKTFLSLNRPNGLPNRSNFVVVDRHRDYPKGLNGAVRTVGSLLMLLPLQHFVGHRMNDTWIIGGAKLYDEAIDNCLVDEIHITLVHTNSGADVKPRYNLFDFVTFIEEQASRRIIWKFEERKPELPADHIPITFVTLTRIPS